MRKVLSSEYFEGGDAKSSIIRRRVQRPRRYVYLDKFSQVLRGSASDDLTAETSYFIFNSLFHGEAVQLLEKRFSVFCSTRFKDEFGCRVLYLWRLFFVVVFFNLSVDSLPVGNCSCLIWTECMS